MTREWFTPAELLALPTAALPRSASALAELIEREAWRSHPTRARQVAGRGRGGGGWEYHLSLFPSEVRAQLLGLAAGAAIETEARRREAVADSLWERYDRLPTKAKTEAEKRLAVVQRVDTLATTMTASTAVALVARDEKVSTSTLWGWVKLARAVAIQDRLPALAPAYVGRTSTAAVDEAAWEFLKADWLRPEKPVFEACFRRLEAAAKEHGWTLPSAKTLRRRLDREVPRVVQDLARKGRQAVEAIYPHQTRDRSVFHALQAVNADGHKFDVFVRTADGTITRPTMLAVQDLYSGMILAHRIGLSENWTLVRSAFADVLESWGIPERCFLDNGRAFASKWMTGGASHRFRFKLKDSDPRGLLPTIGCEVTFTTPYHGQAKPIERAFRDLCEDIAKDPRFAGAYVGNAPDAKPENYGAKAIDLELFRAIVAEGVAAHNARPGRRTQNAAGRSLHETFRSSYETALIRQATETQRRLFLLAAEGVQCREPTGEIQLGGNRYWAEPLAELRGRKVIVRFDPDDLMDAVAVYALDGRYVCAAPCVEATGFADMAAAQDHARRKRAWLKAQRELLSIERTMTIEQVAALLPTPTPESSPEPKVVRLLAAAGGRPAPDEWDGSAAFSRAMAQVEAGENVTPFRRR